MGDFHKIFLNKWIKRFLFNQANFNCATRGLQVQNAVFLVDVHTYLLRFTYSSVSIAALRRRTRRGSQHEYDLFQNYSPVS